jgi:hypothetical protein
VPAKNKAFIQLNKPNPQVPDCPIYLKFGRQFSDDKGLVGIDKYENKIIVQRNLIKLFPKKAEYSTSYKLFTIDNKNKRIICERDYSIHFYKKLNGYGFNLIVLRNAKVSKYVLLKEVRYDKVYYYQIPIKDILKQGKKHQYRKSNIRESQIFIGLEQLEKQYKISKGLAKI